MKNSTKATAALFGLLLGIGACLKAEKREQKNRELAEKNASWINGNQQREQQEVFNMQQQQFEEQQRQHQQQVLDQALENVRIMNNL